MTAAFLVFGLAGFFAPLVAPHQRMREAKEALQRQLSARYDRVEDAHLRRLEALDDVQFAATAHEIESMRQLHELARSLPVWPFDVQILLKLALALAQPALAAVGAFLPPGRS